MSKILSPIRPSPSNITSNVTGFLIGFYNDTDTCTACFSEVIRSRVFSGSGWSVSTSMKYHQNLPESSVIVIEPVEVPDT